MNDLSVLNLGLAFLALLVFYALGCTPEQIVYNMALYTGISMGGLTAIEVYFWRKNERIKREEHEERMAKHLRELAAMEESNKRLEAYNEAKIKELEERRATVFSCGLPEVAGDVGALDSSDGAGADRAP